jgi:hypothetical protein
MNTHDYYCNDQSAVGTQSQPGTFARTNGGKDGPTQPAQDEIHNRKEDDMIQQLHIEQTLLSFKGEMHAKSERHKLRVLLVALTVLLATQLTGFGQQPNSGPELPNSPMSAKAQELLKGRWDDSSFSRGVAILKDRNESPRSRMATLEFLHTQRGRLNREQMGQALDQITIIAKDRAEHPALSARAVRAMANLTLTMEENKHLTRIEAKKEGAFLAEAAQDSTLDPLYRANVINALGVLKIDEAAPVLRKLLKDPDNANRPDIARPACLSLWRIEGKAAAAAATEILQTTKDPSVFGTAAFTLGQIKEPNSVAALVRNFHRFPDSGSCDTALAEMDDVILEVLRNPNHANLAEAIRATRYLWKDGQSDHYVPLLQQLVTTAPAEARLTALDRLLECASTLDFAKEKQQLATILPLISNQPEMDKYVQRIQQRMSATVLTPAETTAPTPSIQEKGN